MAKLITSFIITYRISISHLMGWMDHAVTEVYSFAIEVAKKIKGAVYEARVVTSEPYQAPEDPNTQLAYAGTRVEFEGDEYILAMVGYKKYAFIDLACGNRYIDPVRLESLEIRNVFQKLLDASINEVKVLK